MPVNCEEEGKAATVYTLEERAFAESHHALSGT